MEEKGGKLSIVVEPETDDRSEKKRSFWHIDKEMLPIKMHFFLFEAGMSAVLPYQSALGITKLGFTASNLAATYTAQQFLSILTKPGIGYLTDYFNKLKATIVGLTVLQAAFCFFMIIIPSADVQKSCASQFNTSFNTDYHCRILMYFEEVKNMYSKQTLTEYILAQQLNCFQFSQIHEIGHDEVHCSNKNSNSVHYKYISHQIFQTTGDDALRDCFSSINYTVSHNIHFIDVLFISQLLNTTQQSLVICFLPKQLTLFEEKDFHNLMKQHCYTVLKPETINIQDFLPKQFQKTNCLNYNSNISTSKDGLSAANFKTYQFWLFSLCLIASCSCISSIFTISDTACYECMQGADYGKQRAWGAVSWGLIAPFAGFLNDYTEGYMASWYLIVLFCSLEVWNVSKINLVKPDLSQNIIKDIKTVFSSFEFLAFEAGVFINGLFTGIIWFYLPWFFTTIGGNKLSIGLANTIQCVLGEVPLLFVSTWIIKKFGHFNVVSLALICHGIRFFIYSYLYNPWWILPIEILHGFTFGTFYAAMNPTENRILYLELRLQHSLFYALLSKF